MDDLMIKCLIAFIFGYLFNYIIKGGSVIEGHTNPGDHYSLKSNITNCNKVYNKGWVDDRGHDNDWWDENTKNYRLCLLGRRGYDEYVRTSR